MTAKELYQELLKPQYDSRPYSRMKNWGDKMEIVEEVIDGYWKGVETLENNSNAYRYSAYYQRFAVETFKNGVAIVTWTLYPDGRYFMDEDGYGMEDNDESVLYGFIDTHARVVVPFQAKSWKELEKQRPEAERKAKEIKS